VFKKNHPIDLCDTALDCTFATVTKLPKEQFLKLIELGPLVSIDLIVNCKGKFLIGLRKNKPAQDFWFVPGGRIFKNETLKDAFYRLTLAELNMPLKIDNASFLGVYQHFYGDSVISEGLSTHYIVLAYELRLQSMDFFLTNKQHKSWQWLTQEEIVNSEKVHFYSKAYFSRE